MAVGAFAKPGDKLWQLIPDILQGRALKQLVAAVRRAKQDTRGIIAGFGAHVIKCGLSPLLIDLMERGFITALATNGASLIHDFELALQGQTSEDVAHALKQGTFGMAEETGAGINRLINEAARSEIPLYQTIGRHMEERAFAHRGLSLFYNAYRLSVPLTVHIAIGTDITHMHPEASGRSMGAVSFRDFHAFVDNLKTIHNGGVYLNIGSAVLLPEVFLKAIAMLRNRDMSFGGFSTAVFDFMRQYRPRENVAQRPQVLDSRGFYFVGHHEHLLPLFYYLLLYG